MTVITDRRVSENFWLSEVIRSETADREGIDNLPPPSVLRLIETLTCPGLERTRVELGRRGMYPTSFYRCPELNCMVGGAMTRDSLQDVLLTTMINSVRTRAQQRLSDGRFGESNSGHMSGLAVDFTCPGFGSPKAICEALEKVKHLILYDQLIHEFGNWVHIAFAEQPRLMPLTIDRFGTRHGILDIRLTI